MPTESTSVKPLLADVSWAAPLLGLSFREFYRLAGTPGGFPEGIVVRLGRRVRVSRPRLLAWLGMNEQEHET